jgi:hypothetical protein
VPEIIPGAGSKIAAMAHADTAAVVGKQPGIFAGVMGGDQSGIFFLKGIDDFPCIIGRKIVTDDNFEFK